VFPSEERCSCRPCAETGSGTIEARRAAKAKSDRPAVAMELEGIFADSNATIEGEYRKVSECACICLAFDCAFARRFVLLNSARRKGGGETGGKESV